jgi:hypothetical protein
MRNKIFYGLVYDFGIVSSAVSGNEITAAERDAG